jgi:DNA repair protein RecN (Recombination protein N)
MNPVKGFLICYRAGGVISLLIELTIKNLAVIKAITIKFQQGLNILTGETGAGKSILIDALGFLMGGRASADYVRYGEKRAEIDGLFEIDENHVLMSILPQLGIEPPEDGLLILRREINAQGKSICRINGQMVTLSTLREVGPLLVNIHGQHEHQSLMDTERNLSWLDAFAGEDLRIVKKEYIDLYRDYRHVKMEFNKFAKNEQSLAQRQDMLSYQLQEITEADLRPYEDDDLNKEKNRLVNSERLFKSIDDACRSLTGEQAALDWLGHALSQIEASAALDDTLSETATQLESLFYQLEESGRWLKSYRNQLEFDPARLEQIDLRLSEIHSLKRKYGKNVEEILEYAASIEDELDLIINRDQKLAQLNQKLMELSQDLALEAIELSNRRQATAAALSSEIEAQLKDLHMEKAKFSVEIRHIDDSRGIDVNGRTIKVGETGIDQIEFLISPNPGEPLRPVAKIASGGELSRIMLGMKTILADVEDVGTLIFDEVDTGVSGRAAQAIAEKLALLSRKRQVLCITHLPQMACMADAHFLILKNTTDTETQTEVSLLDAQGRVLELARMLGGAEVTETTKQHAREMVGMANDIKASQQGKLSLSL